MRLKAAEVHTGHHAHLRADLGEHAHEAVIHLQPLDGGNLTAGHIIGDEGGQLDLLRRGGNPGEDARGLFGMENEHVRAGAVIGEIECDGDAFELMQADSLNDLLGLHIAQRVRRGLLAVLVLFRFGEALLRQIEDAGAIEVERHIGHALAELRETLQMAANLIAGLAAAGFHRADHVFHELAVRGLDHDAIDEAKRIHPRGVRLFGRGRDAHTDARDVDGALLEIRMLLLLEVLTMLALMLFLLGLVLRGIAEADEGNGFALLHLGSIAGHEEGHGGAGLILQRVVKAGAIDTFEVFVPGRLAIFLHRFEPALRLLVLHELAKGALVPIGEQLGHVFEGENADGFLRHEVDPLLDLLRREGGKSEEEGGEEEGAFHGEGGEGRRAEGLQQSAIGVHQSAVGLGVVGVA